MSANVVKTRTAEFFIDDNRILWTIVFPDVLIDEHDAFDNLLVVRNLTNGKPIRKILDARASGWKMSEEAKESGKKNYKPELTIARAILINSGLGTHLLNFIKTVFNQSYPVKYFKNEQEAINWLLTIDEK